MPVETEIRLAATAAAMTRLPNAAALTRLTLSRPVTTPLVSVYWDTPSMTLRKNGVALRLRNSGDGNVTQTLKLQSGEVFSRHEFEAPAHDDRPHFALAIEQGWKPDSSLLEAETDLKPAFSATFTRASRTLTFPDGTIVELAFDRGRIHSDVEPDRDVMIREMEIELVEGDVRRLHELASELVIEVPGLRLQFMSKADRGYQLITGVPVPPRRARKIALDRKERAGRVAISSAAEALSHVADNVEGTRYIDDPEYVHQMRIGVRRLRIANALARAAGLPTFSDRLMAELKWLWALLGASRDWDVFEAKTWPAIKLDAGATNNTDAIDAGIVRERAETHRKLRRALDSRRIQRLLLAIPWVLANQCVEADAQRNGQNMAASLSRKLLRKRQDKVTRSGQALRDLSPAERHQLRIDAKKLRYLAEFVADLYPERSVRRYLRRLAKVQTALGGLNDLAAGNPLMKRAMGGDATAEGDTSVVDLLDRYAAARSGAFEKNLQRAWKKFGKVPAFWT